jgi:hypothetical protein
MSKYRKKPVVIEATQWFKNGDHPQDHDPIGIKNPTRMDREKYHEYLGHEGKIVKYYNTLTAQDKCKHCNKRYAQHGWIGTLEGGHIVCPGDWIIKGVQGEFYPCKPDIFKKTYEEVAE